MNEIQIILAGYLYSGFGLCPGYASAYILFEMFLKIHTIHTHTRSIHTVCKYILTHSNYSHQ